MGWYRSHSDHLVHGTGGVERVYVAKGYEPVDDDAAVELVIEHQAQAALTKAEKAQVRKVIRDESPTRAQKRKTPPAKAAPKRRK